MLPSRPARRENRLLLARRSGRKALGFHLITPMVPVIEMLGPQGFDFVYVDGEHGSFELRDVEDACRAAELAGITVVARVPQPDPAGIGRYLDCGVQGIVVPHVSTADAARAAVAACFFPPKGARPFSATRTTSYRTDLDDLDAHMANANANTTLSVQIEDAEALGNLDAIAGVGGIDYITIGKNDLALSLGLPRLPRGHPPELVRTVDEAERLLAARGVPLKDEWMTIGRVKDFIMDGGYRFLAAQR